MEILASARWHGISDDDIRHAVNNALGGVSADDPARFVMGSDGHDDEIPKEMTDADRAALVEQLDAAVDRGQARVVASEVLVELRAAAAARRAADERLESAVSAGRDAGLSWGVIGAQLGVTRQGARQRFERLVST